ncbi:MAG: sigma-70 family RNA polymerase sigma factor [Cyclobacteriaceae bacterium]|nr:sigma-70 family RNA polymerase sigma factor [Cyclobacteriaceae bacterium]
MQFKVPLKVDEIDVVKVSEDEFVQLYKGMYKKLLSYGIKICPDDEVVRDCIHEIFLDIWTNRQKYENLKNIEIYLLKVVRNRLIDHYRSIRKFLDHDIQKLEYAGSENRIPVNFSISQEDIIIQDEDQQHLTQKIANLLNQLTDRQREIIFLKFYNGLNDKQISEITGLQNQSVRNKAHQALTKMKKMLTTTTFLFM